MLWHSMIEGLYKGDPITTHSDLYIIYATLKPQPKPLSSKYEAPHQSILTYLFGVAPAQ